MERYDKILKGTSVKQSNGKFSLFLYEKMSIINSINDEKLLSKRSELINKCRHQNKLLFKSIKTEVTPFNDVLYVQFYGLDSIDNNLLCIYYIHCSTIVSMHLMIVLA